MKSIILILIIISSLLAAGDGDPFCSGHDLSILRKFFACSPRMTETVSNCIQAKGLRGDLMSVLRTACNSSADAEAVLRPLLGDCLKKQHGPVELRRLSKEAEVCVRLQCMDPEMKTATSSCLVRLGYGADVASGLIAMDEQTRKSFSTVERRTAQRCLEEKLGFEKTERLEQQMQQCILN